MIVYCITDSNITELDGVKDIYWRKNKVGAYSGYADITFFGYINVECILKSVPFPFTKKDDESITVSAHSMSILTTDDIKSNEKMNNLKTYYPLRYKLLFPPTEEKTCNENDERISHKRRNEYTPKRELDAIWYGSEKLSKILQEQREYHDFLEEMELERWD